MEPCGYTCHLGHVTVYASPRHGTFTHSLGEQTRLRYVFKNLMETNHIVPSVDFHLKEIPLLDAISQWSRASLNYSGVNVHPMIINSQLRELSTQLAWTTSDFEHRECRSAKQLAV